MSQLLRLAHNCLTFDFIGTSTDESSDDLCTVQIPTNWRTDFLYFTTLQLFFDLYNNLPVTLSPMVKSIHNEVLLLSRCNANYLYYRHCLALYKLHLFEDHYLVMQREQNF